jgi:hypothetical protein
VSTDGKDKSLNDVMHEEDACMQGTDVDLRVFTIASVELRSTYGLTGTGADVVCDTQCEVS